MNGRSISFILLSSAIMMIAMTLQNLYAPPVADPETPADAVALAQQDVSGETTAEGSGAAPLADPVDSQKSSTKQAEDAAQDAAETTPDSAAENEAKMDSEAGDASLDDQFLTIGSLTADGHDRYLITVNQKGGTVRRVELNFRHEKSGKFVYRDLEWTGGYLGQLELIDTDAGCQVRVVGPGTPAANATCQNNAEVGIRKGDVLVSLDGVPATSVLDFNTMLAQTKPGTEATLDVKRDGLSLSFKVALTNMPIELLRPEPGRVAPDYDFPESFVLSLLKKLPELDKPWPDLDKTLREGIWQLDDSRSNDHQITLKKELSAEQLEPFELAGPLTVFKTFTIPDLPTEEIYNLDSRTFHWNLSLEVVNGSDQQQTLAFELDGPTGTPSETWWYANKIHGRSTAIGYLAGARDVVGGNASRPFIFWGGPEIVDGAEEDPVVVNFICDPYEEDPAFRQLKFAGVDTQYFNVSLIPQTANEKLFECNSLSAFVNGFGFELPENAKLKKLVDVTFQMVKAIEIAPQGKYSQSFDVFAGPKEPELLDQYELREVETFGWFAWCSKPLLWLLHFFYVITFKSSYGLAIIMLTILVRSLMIPFSRKAALNAQMMQHLQPQMMEIKKKYPDDMQKAAQAQRELFSKHNYSPLSGCLPMFFQLPIFIGLYRGLSVDMALRDKPLIPGLEWCSNLSGPDQFMYWKDWAMMPSWLVDETGWLGPFLNVLPLITVALFLAQQKLFMPPAADEQQQMMQKMMTFMMPLMGLMFFKVPAGLCIYFITSSFWSIIEKLMLPKPVLDTSKFDTGGDTAPALAFGGPKASADDSAMKAKAQAEREERKRQNAERKKKLRDRR